MYSFVLNNMKSPWDEIESFNIKIFDTVLFQDGLPKFLVFNENVKINIFFF